MLTYKYVLKEEKMGVLINKKRCDNARACSCIESCPAQAFRYDEEKKSVAVDNSLCINCRNCMIACEAGAVKVFRSQEEYEKIKTEYDEDAMTIEELFQDRYGADSIDRKYQLALDKLESLIKTSNKLLLIEFYDEDEATCLINSIPIKEILEAIPKPISYRKVMVKADQLPPKYNISTLPALIILDAGNVLFKHEGFVKIDDKDVLLNKLKNF